MTVNVEVREQARLEEFRRDAEKAFTTAPPWMIDALARLQYRAWDRGYSEGYEEGSAAR